MEAIYEAPTNKISKILEELEKHEADETNAREKHFKGLIFSVLSTIAEELENIKQRTDK